MTSHAYSARSPHSDYDIILIVMSFTIELATPTVMTYVTDTLRRLIIKILYNTHKDREYVSECVSSGTYCRGLFWIKGC